MGSCVDIYNRYKGRSAFVGSKYIDPEGYEYPNSVVECRDCMFNFGADASGNDTCLLYKEMGYSDKDINSKHMKVFDERKCQYFLTRDFSEGDDKDQQAKKEVNQIANRLRYPNRSSSGSTSVSSGGSDGDFNPVWIGVGIIAFIFFIKGCS